MADIKIEYLELRNEKNLLINKKISKKVGTTLNKTYLKRKSKTVLQLVKKVFSEWKIKKKIIIKKKNFKETNFLKLDSKKSYKELNWRPQLNFDETIKLTVDWYKALKSNKDLEKITKDHNYFL